MLMLRLANGRYSSFFPLGDETRAKELRATDHRMKWARITKVLQMWPSSIKVSTVYDKWSRGGHSQS